MRRRSKGEGGITRRADGRWQASYYGSDARRHFLYAPTRKAVAEKLAAAIRDRDLGVYVAGASQTVEVFLASWLRAIEGRLRPRTFERYAGQIRLHVNPAIGSVPLRKLGAQDLVSLYTSLDLAPGSIAHLHRVLHVAFAEAVRWKLIALNPADAVRAPRPAPREMRVLSPEDIRALLEAVRGDENEALYTVAVTCGLRQGELLALRWRDVDLEGGWLDVNATLHRGQRLPTKTAGSRRRVKLGQVPIRSLRAHRIRMAERLIPLRRRTEGDVLVFVAPNGDPLHGPHITERALKPLLARSGLPLIRFHDLRHACASLHLSIGTPLLVVSHMLGHSSPALTLNIYGHMMPLDQEMAVARLDEVLAG